MNDDSRTGIPEVDALIDAADREHGEFWSLTAVSDAEGTVAAVRQSDLAERLALSVDHETVDR
ncbi:hypothetical protein [Nocardia africana]|uniref:Uncharacterized protein n=1 Tax=Nocardia africana TaxID=134964 RepID=A0A379X4M6_9NOCA|nr:hypothetical protein [Nocardia africana]MCC3318440.1 hypothetical protein [Nocardia africana]SUH71913.1 Uncharacterised protein [Nocardia africana]